MKSLLKIKKLSKKSFVIPLFIIISLPSVIIGQVKTEPKTETFTLNLIIDVLQKPNPYAPTISAKNKALIDQIVIRKVNFVLTREEELKLKKNGANDALIRIIKANYLPPISCDKQDSQLNFDQILKDLRQYKRTLDEKKKNEILQRIINDVQTKKVKFPLDKETQNLLESSGAPDKLIKTISSNYCPPPIERTKAEAIYLPKPKQPSDPNILGEVVVIVEIDEKGDVINAKARNGHKELQKLAEDAARKAKFKPATENGKPVKSLVDISYDFKVYPLPSKETPQVEIQNSLEMGFVLIPAGSFKMGSENGDEQPVHEVMIPKSFYMGKYEVTQEQWEKVMDDNPSYFKNCPRCPVENTSWKAVQEFIEKLNRQGEGKYRLPTEAEWEYACRAGSTTKYSFGDDESLLGKYAWYGGNSEGITREVGTKDPNAWGLYDMHGNVYEWCENLYGDYGSGDLKELRVNRGGSYSDNPYSLRSADRSHDKPLEANPRLGFRLVREL